MLSALPVLSASRVSVKMPLPKSATETSERLRESSLAASSAVNLEREMVERGREMVERVEGVEVPSHALHVGHGSARIRWAVR